MTSKRSKVFTSSEIATIKELTEKNTSVTKIAEALGIDRKTLAKHLKENPQLTPVVKKAKEDRRERVKELAQDALELLLTKHSYTETKKKYKTVPVVRREPVVVDGVHQKDEKGNLKYQLLEQYDENGYPLLQTVLESETTTEKFIMPNPMITVFAKCNTEPENYRSINRAEVPNVLDKPNGALKIQWVGTKVQKEGGDIETDS